VTADDPAVEDDDVTALSRLLSAEERALGDLLYRLEVSEALTRTGRSRAARRAAVEVAEAVAALEDLERTRSQLLERERGREEWRGPDRPGPTLVEVAAGAPAEWRPVLLAQRERLADLLRSVAHARRRASEAAAGRLAAAEAALRVAGIGSTDYGSGGTTRPARPPLPYRTRVVALDEAV
jgi:hypothetical protein